jgi:hypothetical protein
MKQYTACALPGCSEPVIPGKPTFRLGSYNAEYHSRSCVTVAFELMRQKKTYAKAQPEKVDYIKADDRQEAAERSEVAQKDNVKVIAKEFGGANVYRKYCDNLTCKGPITVLWKGRRGEYCSNNCLKTEKEKNIMADESNESPIAAGTPATKKGKGKKAAKPVATKKAAAAPAKPVATKKAAAAPAKAKGERDSRLPAVGTSFEHEHKGKTHKIEVTEDGFRHNKTPYKSLSALACAISGYKTCNGFDFFKLNG